MALVVPQSQAWYKAALFFAKARPGIQNVGSVKPSAPILGEPLGVFLGGAV
jgi:hypothetical protein